MVSPLPSWRVPPSRDAGASSLDPGHLVLRYEVVFYSALFGGDRQRLGACDIRHQARKPARKPIDLRSIRHAVWREIEITVDFDLYRLDYLVGPAVRPDDQIGRSSCRERVVQYD